MVPERSLVALTAALASASIACNVELGVRPDAAPSPPSDAAESADAAPAPDGGVAACAPGPFTLGVSTLAGCDEGGMVDGDREHARFYNPVNVVRGPDERLYVADFDNSRIRVIDDDGRTSTLVALDGFVRPFGLAFAADGTLYVSTDANPDGERSPTTGTIWAVDTHTAAASVVVRDVGRPRGLVVLDDGRIVMSDYQHHTLRVLDPETHAITALAGAQDQRGSVDGVGAAARFSTPVGLALLDDGRIAVADMENHAIRAVALDGTVTTWAGADVMGHQDGTTAAARFAYPQGLSATADGAIYVSDTGNYVVRRIADGVVSTAVGNGVPASADADELLESAVFGLEGLSVSADGTRLWIADGSRGEELPHHRVRLAILAP